MAFLYTQTSAFVWLKKKSQGKETKAENLNYLHM